MTRIRKHWSSSREPEASRAPASPHLDVLPDFDMDEVSEGEPAPALVPQYPDDDAIHMLAAVSLEQDIDEPDVKREITSAKVVPTGSVIPQENEQDSSWKTAKDEVASQKPRRKLPVRGKGSTRGKKPANWYRKLSASWNSDRKPTPLANGSKREPGDEDQSKSSSVAESEAKQGPAAVEPVKEMISNIYESQCVEKEVADEGLSRVLQELGASKKKREKPWETVKGGGDSPAKRKRKPTDVDRRFAEAEANKRKPKPTRLSKGPLTAEKNHGLKNSIAEKAVRVNGNGIDGPGGSGGPDSNEDDSMGDRDTAEEDFVPDKAVLNEKKPANKTKKVAANGARKGNSKAKTGRLKREIEDKSRAVPKVIDRKRRAKSQGVGNDDGERKKLRAKPVKSDGDKEAAAGPEDMFPKGWKYKGLAQIAEKDEVPSGQTKKLCGRTDGHNWRCPLRVVEGLSLCQHHLNKARAKKLGRTSQQKRQAGKKGDKKAEKKGEKKANDPPPAPPEPSANKQTAVAEAHGPMKFRRRHKTAKLSGL